LLDFDQISREQNNPYLQPPRKNRKNYLQTMGEKSQVF
jgi:hypothetical protein